jgi:hypothetical protein
MQGFDKDAKGFIDPAHAIENRIESTLKRTDLPASDKEESLRSDRRKLIALRKALPKGVPQEHLTLMGAYLHDHMQPDVKIWRELGAGMRALGTGAIGNRCTRLPALTSPAG